MRTNDFFQMVTYIVDIVANIIEHVHIGKIDVVLVCLYRTIKGSARTFGYLITRVPDGY